MTVLTWLTLHGMVLRAIPDPKGPGGAYVRYDDNGVVLEVLHVYRMRQPALEEYWVAQKRETRARRIRWQRQARKAEQELEQRRVAQRAQHEARRKARQQEMLRRDQLLLGAIPVARERYYANLGNGNRMTPKYIEDE